MTVDKQFVHRVFSMIASASPSAIAVEEEGRQIIYADLETVSGRLAGFLAGAGVKKEAIIGVILPSSVELVASLLGIFRTGAIYLPIDMQFPAKRLQQIFSVSAPEILIIHRPWLDEVLHFIREWDVKMPGIIIPGDMTSDASIQWIAPGQPPVDVNIGAYTPFSYEGSPEDANYIFYTSGSSGEAKPILGCHISLSHFIQWEIREFSLNEAHKISQLTKITFDASLRDIFAALCAGGTLCIPSETTRNNIPLLIRWLDEHGVSLVHCVPSLFRVIIKTLQAGTYNSTLLPRLKYILLAGEVLYSKDISDWRKAAGMSAEIVNLYGATETTLVKTFHRIREISAEASQPVHVGVPIDNTLVAIINDGALCRIGEIGEVYIKTPFATKGYYKNEALTGTVFVQNPLLPDREDIVFRTGDMGRYLPGRNIEILGRLDNQVKINGIRLELNEVEQAMMQLDGMEQVVVKFHKTTDDLQMLIAYYTGRQTTGEMLRDFLRNSLADYAIPAHFIWLEEFPLNLNGKIDRRSLPLPEAIIESVEYVAPEGETEIKIAAIWKSILGLKRISRTASFFASGGHSLLAIQLLSRIYSDLQVDLKVGDIFAHPTIAQQAALIAVSEAASFKSIPAGPINNGLHEVSRGQHRLWTLARLEEGSNAYNMAGAYLLSGHPDLNALQQAFNAFIGRHEILRTNFIPDGAVPKQRVHMASQTDFHISYHDYSNKGYAADDPFIISLINEEAARSFDLENDRLLRGTLLQIAPDQYVFLLVMHHIISDEWSMQILVREVAALYNAFRSGDKADLPELKIQYRDFASWHNKLLHAAKGEENRQFWLQQFADTPPTLKLPTDFVRPEVFTSNAKALSFVISENSAAQLVTLAQQQEATLFMVLLSAVCALIYRKTGQRDQVIGSPMAGRIHKDLEDLMGLFINPLPVRVRFPEASLFTDLLEVVKKTTLSVYNHQLYSLDMLSADLSMKRDFSRSMFFDVAVMLQNVSGRNDGQQAFEGLYVDYLPLDVVSKHDWEFYFVEENGAIHLTIIYNTDLYMPDTIALIGAELLQILESAATTPKCRLDENDTSTMIAERTQPISNIF